MAIIDNIVSGVWLLIHAWGVQFIKYTLVAVAGLLLHIGILTGLVELVNVHYTLAFLAALPFTFGGKFLLDKYWTFTNESKPLGKMLRGGHERSGGKLVA
jgi:putative flippase GtrA